ncbi:hypothetical protein HAX54_043969 [Datura stramonium]|uniref:Uncharacterized protein n=1 Tax=Datura stramonium TaxID=4076 RepID=A0ABS8W359_DATST|nr:hypothetical protein [Datura stramonium]
MRLLLSRSDGLNGTYQGVKEAAIAWKDLVSLLRKVSFQSEQIDVLPLYHHKVVGSPTWHDEEGGVDIISILAKGLPVSNELDLGYDVEHLKSPSTPKKRLVLLIGVFSTGNNFET